MNEQEIEFFRREAFEFAVDVTDNEGKAVDLKSYVAYFTIKARTTDPDCQAVLGPKTSSIHKTIDGRLDVDVITICVRARTDGYNQYPGLVTKGSPTNGWRAYVEVSRNIMRANIGADINSPETDHIALGEHTYTYIFKDKEGVEFWCDGIYLGSVESNSTIHNTFDLRIGSLQENRYSFSGILKDVKIYDRALSDQEIKDYHNQWASQVNLLETFEFEPTDTGQKVVPKGWTRQAGYFHLKSENGENYIEARQAGSRLYKKLNKLDTFTLDFDAKKSSNNVFMKIYLLDHYDKDKGSGYLAGVGFRELMCSNNKGSESILWKTDSRPRPENVWNSYRFTRDSFGKMTMYVKNSDGVYELIPSDDSGTNPVTETRFKDLNYLIISCESSGDCIKNIKITKGVRV